jgi:DNA repair protein RAD50
VLLNGLFQAQEERILDREALIREIATQYGIRGFDVSPLEHNRVIDFTTKLGSLLAQQTAEVESIHVCFRCNYSQPDLPLMS